MLWRMNAIQSFITELFITDEIVRHETVRADRSSGGREYSAGTGVRGD